MDADLRIQRVPIMHPDAQLLVEAVQEEYVVRYGGRDESPIHRGGLRRPPRAVLRRLPRRRAGGQLGRGAAARWSRSVSTSRRRSRGYKSCRRSSGAGSLAGCSPTSRPPPRPPGSRALVLETGREQPEAIALYTSSGYEPVPGFGHYRDSDLSRTFGRRLRLSG